ncbi:MAG: hypothetical protein C4292_03890 [Nitrososphaera sp.]
MTASGTIQKIGVWSSRFIIAAIVQGAVVMGLTLSIIGAQVLVSNINIIQFLSLSFEGPAKWFFLGYILYLILVVAVAVTAVFYSHLEMNLGKSVRGIRSVLAWVHLVGMNIGGAAATIAMVFAGLAGSGMLGVIIAGGELQPNPAIMDQFIVPIAAAAGLLNIGVLAGGLAYVSTYLKKDQ